MKRYLVILPIVALLGTTVLHAQSVSVGNAGSGNGDVCEAFPHSVVPIATASPGATAKLVGLVSGKSIYVCGFSNQNAATSTMQLEYGTKTSTDCDTGAVVLTGTQLSSTLVVNAANATLLTTPVSQELCVVTTGATAAANGWLSYVQY